MNSNEKIFVTTPLLPSIADLQPYLEDIWKRKWITNNGHYHAELEKALSEYLGVPYLSIFTNGTLPLITALQALNITGEVITTPFSFVATSHAIWWNNLKPVFVDIDPETGNLDPDKIEAAITEKTSAIMPVHVYGNPCDSEKIRRIADAHGLKVIYDAAHAFGVKENGKSVLLEGDMSTLSFHATKTYNTVEGGALICRDEETKKRIDRIKDFGIESETSVIEPGINGKFDEIRAAYGLLNLKGIDAAIAHRKSVAAKYRAAISGVSGITLFRERNDVTYNYSYFPIFVDKDEYGMSRDALYETLKSRNIFARRYFYPLISDFSTYRSLPSADPALLPVASRMSSQVLCIPIHHAISEEDIDRILTVIYENSKKEKNELCTSHHSDPQPIRSLC
jgi:dTDP-4-amino-4,6-dideoxygalactose transaminase